ncbi:MAG: hypothetical protein ACTSU5_21750 [Promethearchaeota archaeon]
MEEVPVDDDGWLTCPECGEQVHFAEGEQQREYTGGGYTDYWYEFDYEKCGTAFRSEARTFLS